MKIDFPWPSPPSYSEKPIWTGHGFRVGSRIKPILAYDDEISGWSDELTNFHEKTAGSDHIIDVASRQHAMTQIKNNLSTPLPVILEIGCSSGFMLRLIRQNLPHVFLIGSDIVSGPLLHLAREIPNVPLLQFDLTKCPLPDQCIDIVLLLNVLEHIVDDEAALRHTYRLLKPDGVAIIEVPAGPRLYDLYDRLLKHERRYSQDSLEKLVRGAGFQILTLSHLGFFVYPGFWLVKKWNQHRLKIGGESTEEIVREEIRQTKSNILLSTLMQMESFLGKWISFPWGIRILLTCRRPAE
jgi:SAM-dependent methyltransferase